MRHHHPGIRIGVEERVEVLEVGRVLEEPASRGLPVADELQVAQVALVGGPHVELVVPVRVAGHIGHRDVAAPREGLREQVPALVHEVRRHGVDGAHVRAAFVDRAHALVAGAEVGVDGPALPGRPGLGGAGDPKLQPLEPLVLGPFQDELGFVLELTPEHDAFVDDCHDTVDEFARARELVSGH